MLFPHDDVKTVESIETVNEFTIPHLWHPSFMELRRWINKLPDQREGKQGEHDYVEIHSHKTCRPADNKIIKHLCARKMIDQLNDYFRYRKGPIYWRVPLEIDVRDTAIVTQFDEGEDIDLKTCRKCTRDTG
jgi:hypothetical protein